MSNKRRDLKFQNSKNPRAATLPQDDKSARAAIFNNAHSCVEFRSNQMDIDGSWGWKGLSPSCIQDLLGKIFELQKLTWQNLNQNGSHVIQIVKIIPSAQKRLQQLEKDDLDELYSLRISGKKRIWGIKEGNIFWLLWWDPEHEICPSLKKHT